MIKNYIVLLITGILFILLFLFCIPSKFEGQNVTDVVSTVAAIISPIIGVLSGYALLDKSIKKEKEKDLIYNQNMLESLLIYTIIETQLLVRNILSIAVIGSDDGSRTITLPKDLQNIDQGFILVGHGLNMRDLGYESKNKSVQKFLKDSQLPNLIYSDSWDTYLRAIEDSEDRLIITRWFQTLKSPNIKSYDIITYRDKVIKVIQNADWVKTNIYQYNIKDTSSLLSSYLQECKDANITYDTVIKYN